jgi:hypothetical protein
LVPHPGQRSGSGSSTAQRRAFAIAAAAVASFAGTVAAVPFAAGTVAAVPFAAVAVALFAFAAAVAASFAAAAPAVAAPVVATPAAACARSVRASRAAGESPIGSPHSKHRSAPSSTPAPHEGHFIHHDFIVYRRRMHLAGPATLRGGCHCGAVAIEFSTGQPLDAIGVRECQCTFCRKHGALSLTDRDGHVVISGRDADVIRYRFATRLADFLLCRSCGAWIAAVVTSGETTRSTINARLLDHAFAQSPSAADYSTESADQRLARRLERWTPTELRLS